MMDGPSGFVSNGIPYVFDTFVVTAVDEAGTVDFDRAEATGSPLTLTPRLPPTSRDKVYALLLDRPGLLQPRRFRLSLVPDEFIKAPHGADHDRQHRQPGSCDIEHPRAILLSGCRFARRRLLSIRHARLLPALALAECRMSAVYFKAGRGRDRDDGARCWASGRAGKAIKHGSQESDHDRG
jgi:hypothetical protein